MSEIRWIKISTDVFDNRKIRLIENMPEGDALVVIWFKILVLAGNVNDNGYIYITDEIPYTEQLLATQFNKPLPVIRLALETFKKFGMIEIVDDVIMVSNWNRYQNIEGMEKIREQNRIRKRNQRERERLMIEQNDEKCHVMSRDSHATEKNRKEKDIDKENKYTCAFSEFWKNYPRKKEKNKAYKCYLARLNDGYSEDELLAACINYATECEHNKTDERYIKLGATFLSINEPFRDYLKGENFGQRNDGDSSESEEQRQRELDEVIKRLESGEDDGLWD